MQPDSSLNAAVCFYLSHGQVWVCEMELSHMGKNSRNPENPFFGVCVLVRRKPACLASDTSYDIEILHVVSRCIILFRKQTTKALIRQLRSAV